MTTATMQSTFFTKNDFTIKKESEISTHKLKKLKFLLNKSKEAEIFETEFFKAENLPPEIKIIKQWNLLNSFAKSFIEQAKHSPV
jgi:hypothetical protein